MKSEPVVIEHTYNESAQQVWNALTNKDEMKKWYFDLAEFKPEVGFEFSFTGGPPEKQYLHLCKVTEAVPGKKLTYSWRYDGYAGNSFVTFQLFDEGGKTRLKLSHTNLDTFPQDIPDFKRQNFEMGWSQIINTNLADYLEKK